MTKKILLLGIPNAGKTSLFNNLCKLNQKTGNYPGVTVELTKGNFKYDNQIIEVVDFPGFNTLNIKSKEEKIVIDYLKNNNIDNQKIVLVGDATNLKSSIYLLSQLVDLNKNIIFVINKCDLADKKNIIIDENYISKLFNIEVVKISSRKNININQLKNLIINNDNQNISKCNEITYIKDEDLDLLKNNSNENHNLYTNFLNIIFDQEANYENIDKGKWIRNEAVLRYKFINFHINNIYQQGKNKIRDYSHFADKLLLHNIFGIIFFFFILFIIFQSVFFFSSFPMEWIQNGFSYIKDFIAFTFPHNKFTDFLQNGLIEGLLGVVIFIPQIFLLFLFFTILDETGYMNRVIYIMDRYMQAFGMNGKSIIPLISSFACAVPAILSTRIIENKKERLITILIAPLLTCSARLPVYSILISLLYETESFSFLNKGTLLFIMYLLGIFFSIIISFILNKVIRSKYRSNYVIQMPEYLLPSFRNIIYNVWYNTKSFLLNAGKIILASSIIIYFLSTNGGQKFKNAENYINTEYNQINNDNKTLILNAYKIENSYLGILGKAIEPAIKPLGYDWKIGIALLNSILAREVFVGTLNIIYGIEDNNSEDNSNIVSKLKIQKNSKTNKSTFSIATILSLLVFYAFSMQCISTISVTLKETKSIYWTLFQFSYMTILAYLFSYIIYNIFS